MSGNVTPIGGRAPRPAPGEPAITFGMDDSRITFRDQAALDEYVAGALAEVVALVPIFEAKYGIQSSPVESLRKALNIEARS